MLTSKTESTTPFENEGGRNPLGTCLGAERGGTVRWFMTLWQMAR